MSHSSDHPLPSSVDVLTDEEILVIIDAARKDASTARGITDEHTGWAGPTAWRITPDAVEKLASAHEAYMRFAFLRRCPPCTPAYSCTPRRSLSLVKDLARDRLCAQRVLETAWPRMNWWKRLLTVWRLRRSLQELHRIPLPRPV
ncbi:hypothetical protein CPB85DRAFT_267117 [Mucidula mucida]|nr:hypothetical protein CPB85DRAFT_267117 [Mucidula mucida]